VVGTANCSTLPTTNTSTFEELLDSSTLELDSTLLLDDSGSELEDSGTELEDATELLDDFG